jgi:hypothetical protein
VTGDLPEDGDDEPGWKVGLRVAEFGRELHSGPPRVFRTAELSLFHAASCRFRYSSRASCGVRYPSPE